MEGLSRLVAPFIPFLADEIYLALHGRSQSVHLASYPEADDSLIDRDLESRMEVAMTIASLGRTVRNDASVRVRQPLSEVLIHSDDSSLMGSFLEHEEIVGIVLDELNVRRISGASELGSYVTLSARPNFPALGKRFGKSVPEVANAIKEQTTEALLEFNRSGVLAVTAGGKEVELGRDELSAQVEPVAGYGASADRGITTVLNLEIDEDLRVEGSAREIINRLQNLRKSAGYEVTDRIHVNYTGGTFTGSVFEAQDSLVATETLADRIEVGDPGVWPDTVTFELEGEEVVLWIRKTD
jgi:isoleucyl-tRNA synthetase